LATFSVTLRAPSLSRFSPNGWQFKKEKERKADVLAVCRSPNEPANAGCITDLKQRLLKVALERQPKLNATVDDHAIKALKLIN
jgi:hypothetical protein